MSDESQEINKLKGSPLYAMSLGSKELFHSNFWAWLIDHNTRYFNVFFEADISLGNISIFREKGNRDLTICIEKEDKVEVYIIENKIKSIPYKKQLTDYQDMDFLKDEKYAQRTEFKGGLLTGLMNEPEWINDKDLEKWKFLSYAEIAKGIAERNPKNSKNDDIIEQYCNDIKNLHGLVSNKLKEARKDLSWNFSDAKELEDIRFDDAYKKLKADMIAKELEFELKSAGINNDFHENFEFRVITELTNKQPCISFKFIYKPEEQECDSDKSKKITAIGIQIQGQQFNRFAEIDKNITCDELFDAFKNIGWFSDYDKKNKIINFKLCEGESENKTGMAPRNYRQFNKYNDNFVRQFFIMKDQSIGYMYDNLKKHLKYAESILDKAKEIFD